ncbi:hypothetical protein CSQ93_03455 [Janthinobacterium sp. BJB426]|nr:hypothetical protein CSQ93_03455 [Janthinobacterium sp. BJB426]
MPSKINFYYFAFSATMALLYFFYRLYREKSRLSIILFARQTAKSFFSGTLTAFLLKIVIFIFCALIGGFKFIGFDMNVYSAFSVILYSLTAALFEEIIFRGILMSALLILSKKFVPCYFAVIVQALFFSGLHLQSSFQINPFILSTFIFSLWMGLVAIRTKNLWWPIGFHFTWNLNHLLLMGNRSEFMPKFGPIFEFQYRQSVFGLFFISAALIFYFIFLIFKDAIFMKSMGFSDRIFRKPTVSSE